MEYIYVYDTGFNLKTQYLWYDNFFYPLCFTVQLRHPSCCFFIGNEINIYGNLRFEDRTIYDLMHTPNNFRLTRNK